MSRHRPGNIVIDDHSRKPTSDLNRKFGRQIRYSSVSRLDRMGDKWDRWRGGEDMPSNWAGRALVRWFVSKRVTI